MAKKKLTGQIEIRLESKQFKSEAKALTTTLNGLQSPIKKVGIALKSIQSDWIKAAKEVRTFKSASDMVTKISYNNLKSNTDTAAQATKKFGGAGAGAASQLKSLKASATATGEPITRMGQTTTKTTQSVKQMGQTTQQAGKTVQTFGIYQEKTTRKLKVMDDALGKSQTSYRKVTTATDAAIKRFQAAGKQIDTTALKTKKLTDTTKQTTQSQNQLSATLKSTTATSKQYGQSMTQTASSSKKLSDSNKQSTQTQKQLDMTLKSLLSSFKKLDSQLKSTSQASKQYGQSMSQASQQTKQMGAATTQASKDTKDMGQTLESTGSSTSSTAGKMTALATSVQGLAGGITGVSDSLFGFQEKIIALNKSKFGLKETTEDLKRAEEDFAAAMQEGEMSTQEMERAEKDLLFLREKLAIETEEVRGEQEALNSEYVSFAVNLGSVGIQAATLIPTLKETGVMAKFAGIQSKFAGVGANGLAGGLRSAGGAAKGFMISIGPIGWAIIGITALWAVWETNLFGFRDVVHQIIDVLQDVGEKIKWLFPIIGMVDEGLKAMGINVGKNIDEWQELEQTQRKAGEEMKELTGTTHNLTSSSSELSQTTDVTSDSIDALGSTVDASGNLIMASNDAQAISFNGLSKSVEDWAEITGLSTEQVIDYFKAVQESGGILEAKITGNLDGMATAVQSFSKKLSSGTADSISSLQMLGSETQAMITVMSYSFEQGSLESEAMKNTIVKNAESLMASYGELGPAGEEAFNILIDGMIATATATHGASSDMVKDLQGLKKQFSEFGDVKKNFNSDVDEVLSDIDRAELELQRFRNNYKSIWEEAKDYMGKIGGIANTAIATWSTINANAIQNPGFATGSGSPNAKDLGSPQWQIDAVQYAKKGYDIMDTPGGHMTRSIADAYKAYRGERKKYVRWDGSKWIEGKIGDDWWENRQLRNTLSNQLDADDGFRSVRDLNKYLYKIGQNNPGGTSEGNRLIGARHDFAQDQIDQMKSSGLTQEQIQDFQNFPQYSVSEYITYVQMGMTPEDTEAFNKLPEYNPPDDHPQELRNLIGTMRQAAYTERWETSTYYAAYNKIVETYKIKNRLEDDTELRSTIEEHQV